MKKIFCSRQDSAKQHPDREFRNDILFYGIVVLLGVIFLWRVLPALNPPSLWFDDIWVASLTKLTFGNLLEVHVPTPTGFLYLEKIAGSLFSDPEWSLQLVPLLCALLSLGVIAAVGRLLFSSRLAAVLLVSFSAVNPLLTTYAARVKQYSCDFLITSVIIYLAVVYVNRKTVKSYAILCGACVLGFIFSFPAVYVIVATITSIFCATIYQSRTNLRKERIFILITIGTSILLVLILCNALAAKQQTMTAFWQAHYIPFSSFAGILTFFKEKGVAVLTGVFPNGLAVLSVLIVLGMISLLLSKRTRMLGIIACLVYIELVSSSALQLYPLGTGRTDLFCFPLAMIAFVACFRFVPTCYKTIPLRSAAFVAVSVMIICLGAEPRAEYPFGEDAGFVQQLNKIHKDTALVIYPEANWAVSYYGKWPSIYVATPFYPHGFEMIPRRENTLMLRGGCMGEAYAVNPNCILSELDSFLSSNYAKVYYFSAYSWERVRSLIQKIFFRHKYAAVDLEKGRYTMLIQLSRRKIE